jgi:hypothetical protein
MATTTKSPISNLMYNWLTVLQNKAKGVTAYEVYLKDAEAEGDSASVTMFRRLQEEDSRQLEELRNHVFGMIAKSYGGK